MFSRLRKSRPVLSPRSRIFRRGKSRQLFVESLEGRQLLTSDLVITEFLAANDNGLRDMDYSRPDWIEILTMDSVADVGKIKKVFDIELDTIRPYLQEHLAG